MMKSLPKLVDDRIKVDSLVRSYMTGEYSAKRHNTTKHGTFELGGLSFGQEYESEPDPSTSEESTCKDLIHQEPTSTWKAREEIYSNSKIVQIIKTYWEPGHDHKFITEIVARRANRSIVSITESDYKNLNKNDIARIAQSSALPPVADEPASPMRDVSQDEPASPMRDVSQGEACPTDSGFVVNPDRTNIAKTSTLPHESTSRVTSLAADEGSLQLRFQELTDFCTSLQRQQSELVSKFAAQALEITELKARVKFLEDGQGEAQALEITELKARVKFLEDGQGEGINLSGDDAPIKGMRLDEEEVATERVSSDTEEIRLDEMEVAAERVSNDTEEMATVLTTMDASVYFQVEEFRWFPLLQQLTLLMMNAQIARDEEIAKIHTEEELQQMIEATELIIGERIELISDLVKYQDHHFKILQYQAQQIKTRTKKQKRDFYMAVIKNNLGGVSKIYEGEAAWLKKKGIRSEQESAKKQKTSEEVHEEVKSSDEVLEEKIKELIRLVPIEKVYVEALQVKHPIIDWKARIEGQRSYWKITRLGGSSASYQFFVDMLKQIDREDLNQLWALVKETLSVRPAIEEKKWNFG
nr:hypothetical protein [Tanacetum cinerariifolium]